MNHIRLQIRLNIFNEVFQFIPHGVCVWIIAQEAFYQLMNKKERTFCGNNVVGFLVVNTVKTIVIMH